MKNPDLTITITGQKAKGKSCLAHALALCLQRGGLHVMQKGCSVFLTDEGRSLDAEPMNGTRYDTPFSDEIAAQFSEPRNIQIVVRSANSEGELESALQLCHRLRDGAARMTRQQFRNCLKRAIGADKDYADGVWISFQNNPAAFLAHRQPQTQSIELLRVLLEITRA